MKEVSIVILTFNQCAVTLRCLDSIKELTDREDYEVILVDNGSVDDTLGQVASRYPSVRCISLGSNRGVAAGRNAGMAIATGKKILLLDNDTIATPEAIEGLRDALDRHPDWGLVAPRLENGGKVQTSFKNFPGIKEKLSNWLSKERKNDYIDEVPREPVEPFYVIGAAQMFPAAVLQKVGELDEHIFFGPEDADFCMRIRKEGKKVVYLPHISIRHDWRRSTSARKLSPLALKHIKGLLYFYWKHKRL